MFCQKKGNQLERIFFFLFEENSWVIIFVFLDERLQFSFSWGDNEMKFFSFNKGKV